MDAGIHSLSVVGVRETLHAASQSGNRASGEAERVAIPIREFVRMVDRAHQARLVVHPHLEEDVTDFVSEHPPQRARQFSTGHNRGNRRRGRSATRQHARRRVNGHEHRSHARPSRPCKCHAQNRRPVPPVRFFHVLYETGVDAQSRSRVVATRVDPLDADSVRLPELCGLVLEVADVDSWPNHLTGPEVHAQLDGLRFLRADAGDREGARDRNDGRKPVLPAPHVPQNRGVAGNIP